MPKVKKSELSAMSKKDPLSGTRHTLKGPLTTIHLYTEALLSDHADNLTQEQKEYLGEIYKASKMMVDIVNKLR